MNKVAFGTPEFLILRQEINTLCEQRRLLGTYYEDNKDEHHELTRNIRELCERVYFKPEARPVYVRPPVAPPPPPKEVKSKKKKMPMKLPPKLF